MKKYFVAAAFTGLLACSLVAVESPPSSTAPNKVYVQRADKILHTLALTDSTKAARVRQAIVSHYHAINAVDGAVKAESGKSTRPSTEGGDEPAPKKLQEAAKLKLDLAHRDFVSRLAADLDPAQIEKVKDGLTYGVLPLTYRVYQQMLPDLTAEQKAQILAWLTEARELAMDAGSAEEKHAWFGKYKGKINNYLAKAGYNVKQAEKEFAERNKAAAKTSAQQNAP